MLAPEALAAGHCLIHRAAVLSTMDEGRAVVAAGSPSPVWIVADEQLSGRGRHGRVWTSPPGNLYATLALPNPCEPERAPEIGFVAGIALHSAVAEVTGLAPPDLAVKWPNDLLLCGGKLAGVLLEGSTGAHGFGLLVGFGVNIASAPSGTPYPAASLSDFAVERDALFAALARNWAAEWARWRSGFDMTRSAWLAVAAGIGREVTIRPPSGELRGVMSGIDARGRLRLVTAAGERIVDAGDLYFGAGDIAPS